MLPLSTSVTSLKMIGPAYALRLKKMEIKTVEDLLCHLPFRYEDFSIISKINLLQAGEKVTIVGTIISIGNVYTKQGKKIQKALIGDETGEIEIVWYNQPFLVNLLRPETKIAVAGEVSWFNHKFVFESPEYEIIQALHPRRVATQHSWGGRMPACAGRDSPGVVSEIKLIHTGRLVPIYPETAGISSKWLRSRINSILHKFYPQINEFLPVFTLRRFNLVGEKEAIYQTHFPKSYQQAEAARRRLAFDELLTLQLATKIRCEEWQKETVGHKFQISVYKTKIQEFINCLPFKLTEAQKKAIGEILTDLSKNKPMNRLLEGDVGSGKTVVATIAMYVAYLNGYQSAIMAPTEILAEQHYQTITQLLKPHGVRIALLIGSKRQKSPTPVGAGQAKGKWQKSNPDIYIGTHALLSEKVTFSKLGLIVIDEQQRFGVEQRALLRDKGKNPHVLTVTATPIPRSIALTIYADLDLSVIDELPKGRIRIKTWVVPPEKRKSAYNWIYEQITATPAKQQVFIICPLIEESETLTSVRAAKAEYQRLKKEIFPDLKVGLLHGRLKTKEKDRVLSDFKSQKLDILVSTPVVEVGIDIPNATIMMVEAAERFGLSQLHQLRGRVGRNEQQAYCLLFTETNNSKILQRLKTLEVTFDGPKLAELDLKLRGAGELFGTKQHGQLGLKIADISDLNLIEETKKTANFLFTSSPTLSEFPLLREKLGKYTIGKVAPD